MKFFDNLATTYINGFTFKGKARISEYSGFVLFSILVIIVLCFIGVKIDNILPLMENILTLFIFYFFTIGVPFLALQSRRLYDVGIPGIIAFIPIVVLIIHLFYIENFISKGEGMGGIIHYAYAHLFYFFLKFILFIVSIFPRKVEDGTENKIEKEENNTEEITKNKL